MHFAIAESAVHVPDRDPIEAGSPHPDIRNRVPPEIVAEQKQPPVALRLVFVHLPVQDLGSRNDAVIASIMSGSDRGSCAVQSTVDRNVGVRSRCPFRPDCQSGQLATASTLGPPLRLQAAQPFLRD